MSPILGADGRPISNAPLDAPWIPQDPLKNVVPRVIAGTYVREIPATTVITNWTVPQVRETCAALILGLFDLPAQLLDEMYGDSRVKSAMAKLTAILSRPVKFKVKKRNKGNPVARQCLTDWENDWPHIGSEAVLSELIGNEATLGFQITQLLWDSTRAAGQRDHWCPYPKNWYSRYSYYYWGSGGRGRYMAITLDGQYPITPGDGRFCIFSRHNLYRGWIRGAIRAVAPWWLGRQYGLRDWQRYEERNGFPWIKALTPAGADPADIAAFLNSLKSLGQETIMQLPQYNEQVGSNFNVELLEAQINNWEGFQRLIECCNGEIAQSYLGQNLTTEVKEGSLAAARQHGDAEQVILAAIARALCLYVEQQWIRPYALINYGDPDMACEMVLDLAAPEDKVQMTAALKNFGDAIAVMRKAGIQYNRSQMRALAKSFGLPPTIADFKAVDVIAGGSGGGFGGGGGGSP
jgi:uncharacterized protein DUF935